MRADRLYAEWALRNSKIATIRKIREDEALLQQKKAREALKKEVGSPRYKDVGHSDKLYEDPEARKLRLSKLQQKI